VLQPGDWDYVLVASLGTSLIKRQDNPENLKPSSFRRSDVRSSEPVVSDNGLCLSGSL
jgi:hypothetical protein